MTEVFLPADAEIRERVIRQHDRLFAVEAGAGTGKTSLLTSRYVHLVQDAGARPTQIVTITFTEKAAGELRTRIRAALRANGLEDAADDLDRAPIATIHAFASSLLRERPLEAGLDPSFEQMDEIESDAFHRRTYEAWLGEAVEREGALLSRSLSAGLKLENIRELAFELLAYRDLLPTLEFHSARVDVSGRFAKIDATAQKLWQQAEKECVEPSDAGFQSIQKLRAALASLEGSPSSLQERAILLRLSASAGGAQKNWSSAEKGKQQKEGMKELGMALETLKRDIRTEIFSDLLSWLSGFVSYAEREKRKAGKVDFDDLLFLTRDLLRNHADACDDFRRRFRFVLVDEFQDTDPVQTEIIWRLASQPGTQGDWTTLPLDPGKLFLVGDPKQSIYRFRRADIAVFNLATQNLCKKGERLVIRQNFRSSAPLIGFVNQLFGQVLGETYQQIEADPRHLFDSKQKAICVLEPPALSGQEKQRQLRALEAESIAAYIRNLLESSRPLVWDSKKELLRPVRPGDIAILFPTATEIDLFEEALRRYQLSFSLEGGKMFYFRSEIHALLRTLEAVESPSDPIAVAAALRSSLFGLSDEELLTLSKLSPGLDLRAVDLERAPEPIRTAAHLIRSWHQKKDDQPPSHLVEAILAETFAIPLTLFRYHGEQAAANLHKLNELLRRIELRAPLTLRGAIRFFRDRAMQEEKQEESLLSEGEDDRVRLMTIHKAKGLEFPVVILANLGSTRDHSEHVLADRLKGTLTLGFGSQKSRFSMPDYEEKLESERIRQSEERRRLLYVAATRARDLLVLARFLPSKGTSKNWEILDPALPAAEVFVEKISADQLQFIEGDAGLRKEEDSSEEVEKELARKRLELTKELATRAEKWRIGLPLKTATSLVEKAQPSSERRSRPRDPLSVDGRAFGTALHAILEKVDFKNPTLLEAVILREAKAAGIEGSTAQLKELLEKALTSDLFHRIRKSSRQFRELPFTFLKSGTIYEGMIDLAFEEEGRLVIVDYKTDRLSENDLPSRAEHYRPQIQLYVEALEALSGKTVSDALLYFVRLDRAVSIR